MGVRRSSVAAVVVCAMAAGCTGGDEPTPSTTTLPVATTTSTTAEPTVEPVSIGALATAIAGRDPDALASAVALAEPGSPASVYLRHQADARRLLPPGEPAEIRTVGGRSEICDGTCVVLDELVIDRASGLVESFSVDGVPIAARIAHDGTPVVAGEVELAIRSASRSTNGDVSALVAVTNAGDVGVEWFGFAAVLLGADGSVAEASGSWGPTSVPPGSSALLLIAFPDADLAGVVRITGLRDDDLEIAADVEIPTAP